MQETINEIKALIASGIDLGGMDINRFGPDAPIFSKQGLGLDSLDAIELLILLQKKYGVCFESLEQLCQTLNTLGALAQYIEEKRAV